MASSFYPSYTQGELDPQAEAILQQIEEANLPGPHTLTPQQVRERTWPGMRDLIGDPEVVANVFRKKVGAPFWQCCLPGRGSTTATGRQSWLTHGRPLAIVLDW